MRIYSAPRVVSSRACLSAALLAVLGLVPSLPILEAAEPQTISWAAPAEGTALRLNEPFTLVANASSGLPVSFRVVTGPATLEGNSVKAVALGPIQIIAEQPGNADHLPVSLTRIFNRTVATGSRVALVDTPGAPMDIVVRDGFAYVADGPGGFQIIDVHNPQRPVIVGSLPPIGSTGPGQVTVQGHHAFLGEETRGLRIVDIADPSAPKDVTVFPSQNWVLGVTVLGSRAFLTEYQYGLEIVDIADPNQTVALARYPIPGQARQVWAEGNLAYVAIERSIEELQVLDLTDPTHPVLLGSTAITPSPRDLKARGRYAFVAAEYNEGLQTVDVGDPRNPVAFIPIPGSAAWGLELSGDRAYLSGSGGLVYGTCPPHPNPSNSATTSPQSPQALPRSPMTSPTCWSAAAVWRSSDSAKASPRPWSSMPRHGFPRPPQP